MDVPSLVHVARLGLGRTRPPPVSWLEQCRGFGSLSTPFGGLTERVIIEAIAATVFDFQDVLGTFAPKFESLRLLTGFRCERRSLLVRRAPIRRLAARFVDGRPSVFVRSSHRPVLVRLAVRPEPFCRRSSESRFPSAISSFRRVMAGLAE